MKFQFKASKPEDVTQKIMQELGGRELGKMVNLQLSGSELSVTISKLGTSSLTFSQSTGEGFIRYELQKEKIAIAHKAFKDEVKSKLCRVIEKCGGEVLDT